MFQAMVKQHPNALMVLAGSAIGIVLAVVAFGGYGRAVDLDLYLMTGSAAGAYVGLLLGSDARSRRPLPAKRTKPR